MPVNVDCEKEEWMHLTSITENPKLTSVPDGSDVRKVRFVKFSRISGYF